MARAALVILSNGKASKKLKFLHKWSEITNGPEKQSTVDSTEKIRKLLIMLAHGSRLRAPLRLPSSAEMAAILLTIHRQTTQVNHDNHVGVVSRRRIYHLCGRYWPVIPFCSLLASQEADATGTKSIELAIRFPIELKSSIF